MGVQAAWRTGACPSEAMDRDVPPEHQFLAVLLCVALVELKLLAWAEFVPIAKG